MLQLCAGEKAHFMDKENEDWAPSIRLPDCEINDEENDFRDAMPNTPSELDQLEFDHTLIQKETSEINELVTSMENCDETMYLAQSKMPENINAEASQYIAILRTVILAQAQRIDELTAKLRQILSLTRHHFYKFRCILMIYIQQKFKKCCPNCILSLTRPHFWKFPCILMIYIKNLESAFLIQFWH